MREKPIILEAEAVSAILSGQMTMHLIPVQKTMQVKNVHDIEYYIDGILDSRGTFFRYPFGTVGDRIWVREPFRISSIQYKADGDSTAPKYGMGGWQGSVYMPRWASRLTMDVLNVQIRPLHSITAEEAAATGSDIFDFNKIWNKRHKLPEHQYASNPMVWITEFQVI